MNKSISILVFIFLSIQGFGQKFQMAVIELTDGSIKTGLVKGKIPLDSKEIKFKTDEDSKIEEISKNLIKSIDFHTSNGGNYHMDTVFITNEKKTKTDSAFMLKVIDGYYDLYLYSDYSFDKNGSLRFTTDYISGSDLPSFNYLIKGKNEKYADYFATFSPSPTFFGLHKILKGNVIKFMSDDKVLVDKVEKKKLSTKNIEQIVKEYNEFKLAN